MRNLLSLVGLVVVLFLGVGWYCNWYTAKILAGTDGRLNVSFDVDQKKVGMDVDTATDKVGKFVSAHTKVEPPAVAPAEFVGPPAPPAGWKSPTAR